MRSNQAKNWAFHGHVTNLVLLKAISNKVINIYNTTTNNNNIYSNKAMNIYMYEYK